MSTHPSPPPPPFLLSPPSAPSVAGRFCGTLTWTTPAGEGAEGVTKKQLALTMALKQVEMAYGKGAVMQLGSRQVSKVGKRRGVLNW